VLGIDGSSCAVEAPPESGELAIARNLPLPGHASVDSGDDVCRRWFVLARFLIREAVASRAGVELEVAIVAH
jgi:hypothetical protein